MQKTYGPVAVLVAIILTVFGLLYVAATHVSSNGRGGTSNADSITLDNNMHVGQILAIGTGTNDANTGYQIQISQGSCAGLATSTQFSALNPFSATSTAAVRVSATAASSTMFMVGTTTLPSGLSGQGSLTVSTSLLFAQIPTSTSVALISGAPLWLASSTLGYTKVLVGPNQYVGAYATSTYPTGFTHGIASCTYKIIWESF